jgi:hypothetical protein
MSIVNTYVDSYPGEMFFTSSLQNNLIFTLGKKVVKQGRLILFKQAHFYIQLSLLSNKNVKEVLEIPIPFYIENYPHEKLIYFDYRFRALAGNDTSISQRLQNVTIKNINPSQYYNKILEIKTINP